MTSLVAAEPATIVYVLELGTDIISCSASSVAAAIPPTAAVVEENVTKSPAFAP